MAFKLIPKGRTSNPATGRHNIGAPIARSGTRPPKRTGRPSGSVIGTGVNNKTSANAEYAASGVRGNHDTAQNAQWLNAPPEPFRNPTTSQNPRKYPIGPSAKVGGMGGKTGVTGAMGSGGNGRAPRSRDDDMAAAGYQRGYQYRGLNPINSGRVTTQAPKKNTDNGAQPQKFKTNADIFNDAYANFKKWGG